MIQFMGVRIITMLLISARRLDWQSARQEDILVSNGIQQSSDTSRPAWIFISANTHYKVRRAKVNIEA